MCLNMLVLLHQVVTPSAPTPLPPPPTYTPPSTFSVLSKLYHTSSRSRLTSLVAPVSPDSRVADGVFPGVSDSTEGQPVTRTERTVSTTNVICPPSWLLQTVINGVHNLTAGNGWPGHCATYTTTSHVICDAISRTKRALPLAARMLCREALRALTVNSFR